MRAVRLHDYRTPLSIDEVPQPDLQGPHDVLVRIGGAGVCRTDLHVIEGWFEEVMGPELPFALGHENAGWVAAVGDQVTSVRVGDTVIAHPLATCGVCPGCRRGEDMYCVAGMFTGVNADGGYAEYLRTNERALVVLPPSIDPVDVAPYADAGLTAYRAVRKAAKVLQPGQTAVVLGAGGLGHIGIQLLAAMTPARVVAVDRSEPARTLATELGAEAVFGSEDAVEGITELTEGAGADLVIDFVVEHGTPQQAVQLLGQGGTYSVVGYGAELGIPTMEMVLKELTVVSTLVGNHTDLRELMALVLREKVRLVTTRYDLEDATTALDDLAGGRIRGRGVLVPGTTPA